MKKLSFIIPIKDEEQNIKPLYSSLLATLQKNQFDDYEIIYINDGSVDKSLVILKELEKKDKNIQVISFRRNMGKAVALNQGFIKAKGGIVITMDGDMQDGPENVPLLLEKYQMGYDLVVGWKKKRLDPLGKTLPSRVFNWFVGFFVDLPLHDFNSGYKVMSAEVAKGLNIYGELHRFIPVLVYQEGYKVTEVPVTHHPRKFGFSKYGWSRLIKGFFDFLTVMYLGRFSSRPLHFFGGVGSISMVIGIGMGVYLSVLHFVGYRIGNRPLLILSVLLIVAGLQLLSIGFMAEMMVNRFRSQIPLPIDYETERSTKKK